VAEQFSIVCSADLEVFADDVSAWVIGLKIVGDLVSLKEKGSSGGVDLV